MVFLASPSSMAGVGLGGVIPTSLLAYVAAFEGGGLLFATSPAGGLSCAAREGGCLCCLAGQLGAVLQCGPSHRQHLAAAARHSRTGWSPAHLQQRVAWPHVALMWPKRRQLWHCMFGVPSASTGTRRLESVTCVGSSRLWKVTKRLVPLLVAAMMGAGV